MPKEVPGRQAALTGEGTLADAAPASTARVLIRRTRRDDIGQRQVYVRVDNGPTHTLLHGQSAVVEVVPGPHALKANNTLFWKTLRFDVAPDEEIEFAVVNKAGRMSFSLLALLGVGPLFLVIEEAARRQIG